MWKVEIEDKRYNKFEFCFVELCSATGFIAAMNNHVDMEHLKFTIEYVEEGDQDDI